MNQEQMIACLPAELAGRVKSARMVGERAVVVVDASGLSPAARAATEQEISAALEGREGVAEVRVAMMADKVRRRLIAIGSGKGGVGKSTLTTNLAVALQRKGLKVGVVDADIYGPSQPKLLATEGEKPRAENDKLIPIDSRFGVPVLSMGHLVKQGQALAWRGPMAGNALSQLVDADWGDTELLLIDLPPGTGDVQLSMLQKHKPDGAVLVSTPQDLALIDAARAGQLFDTGGVPIIGLVENMAGYACPHCGEVSDPFGKGGVETAAARLELPFLGRIPLSLPIREAGDKGEPSAAGESEDGAAFRAIADRIADWLAREAA
ncbi:Mrp/NBP35 family ATP-binding protein [Altererythrobacter arenosus]|uniref:Iron-sulfur cluster carrier protein n=1 Tax=Altererythrobacter arenosus TaxID=3032592 RepID=A0ABY8FVN7_9SPHN|nr:Mrp/NBP35 family ATP-binding protein [Altererythrobacter sp. CAU 1644]WFL78310.1 Mrp/NBP35 family ATP-binding protein [Altererythrobacter sp. CAU 1644]